MRKLMKNIFLVSIGAVLSYGGGAIAEPLKDLKTAHGLADVTSIYSLFTQVADRVVSLDQSLPKPIAGRNKLGLPVPDAVKTARTVKRLSAFLSTP